MLCDTETASYILLPANCTLSASELSWAVIVEAAVDRAVGASLGSSWESMVDTSATGNSLQMAR